MKKNLLKKDIRNILLHSKNKDSIFLVGGYKSFCGELLVKQLIKKNKMFFLFGRDFNTQKLCSELLDYKKIIIYNFIHSNNSTYEIKHYSILFDFCKQNNIQISFVQVSTLISKFLNNFKNNFSKLYLPYENSKNKFDKFIIDMTENKIIKNCFIFYPYLIIRNGSWNKFKLPINSFKLIHCDLYFLINKMLNIDIKKNGIYHYDCNTYPKTDIHIDNNLNNLLFFSLKNGKIANVFTKIVFKLLFRCNFYIFKTYFLNNMILKIIREQKL